MNAFVFLAHVHALRWYIMAVCCARCSVTITIVLYLIAQVCSVSWIDQGKIKKTEAVSSNAFLKQLIAHRVSLGHGRGWSSMERHFLSFELPPPDSDLESLWHSNLDSDLHLKKQWSLLKMIMHSPSTFCFTKQRRFYTETIFKLYCWVVSKL